MHSSREAGYTLIEMLIALALISLLSVLIVSSLRLGAQAWEAGDRQSRALRETAIAQATLRRAIGSAYPFFDTAGASRPHVAFEGGASDLAFLAPNPRARTAGLSRISLAVLQDAGKSALVMSVRQELANDETKAISTTLARGVKQVTFAYYGSDVPFAPGTWHETWINQKAMPSLVRVRIAFEDARTWPELIIAPELNADVSCSFDPLTKSCRGR